MSPSRAPADVEAYLHSHIPISASMGVRVSTCEMEGVVLEAPLAANVNHRETVFGGSASSVAILSAWTWFHWALLDQALRCHVVIQRNQMEYNLPIEADFSAHCVGIPPEDWERVIHMLRRHGKARISLRSWLEQGGRKVAQFNGDYVAVFLPIS